MKNIIDLHDLTVAFDGTTYLDIAALAVGAGERVFVLGRSGSGKTTLSRVIKGRVAPTAGTVRVLGLDPNSPSPQLRRELQRRVAMIDQAFFLVPRMSVIANVLAGALGRIAPLKSMIGWYPQHEWEVAESILSEVELDGLGDRRVETLSGGQRQRVAIARALMQNAEIILADEPISNLDPELAEDAMRLLVDCVTRRGVTLIVNLHQPAIARRFASRLIGLAGGKVVYDNTPDKFTTQEVDAVYKAAGQALEEVDDFEPESSQAVANAGGRSGLRMLRR